MIFAPPEIRRSKLSFKDLWFLSTFFSRNKFWAVLKMVLFKLGFDICLSHDNLFRDPNDCPECMTAEEWKHSKYRHLGRNGTDEMVLEDLKKGIPVPLDACKPFSCIHTKDLDYAVRCDLPDCPGNLCNIEGHQRPEKT